MSAAKKLYRKEDIINMGSKDLLIKDGVLKEIQQLTQFGFGKEVVTAIIFGADVSLKL